MDECSDQDSQREILDTLLYVATASQIPFRLLVCSRPESQIVNFFLSRQAQDTLFKIFLCDEYSPDEDIRLYLSDRLMAIKKGHIFKSSIPDSWPGESHIEQIVRKSSGQFIYATIVIRYLESPRHRPHQSLDSILGLRPPFKDLPFAQLDALYTHILQMLDNPQPVLDLLAFPVMYNGVQEAEVERILELEPGDGEVFLSGCASIIHIRTTFNISHSPSRYVYLLHKSFADFLLDPHRSQNFSINYVDTTAKHIFQIIKIFSGAEII